MKLDIKSVWTICLSTINWGSAILHFWSAIIFFLQTRTLAKAYRIIATQRVKPDVRLPHGYTASKCPSWSRSVCQWTASQAKESEAQNVPEMGGAIRSRVPGGNVAWLRDGLAVKSHYRLTIRSTSLHDRISWQTFASSIAPHPGFALRLRACAPIRRSDSLAEHIDFCSGKCHKYSENVRCPTVISSPANGVNNQCTIWDRIFLCSYHKIGLLGTCA